IDLRRRHWHSTGVHKTQPTTQERFSTEDTESDYLDNAWATRSRDHSEFLTGKAGIRLSLSRQGIGGRGNKGNDCDDSKD
ncbi:hypothetical protein BGZ76_008317, partial [Entomortierella beljakovae]